MTPATRALFISVLFLCGLAQTVLSQRGLCAGNQCSALFQESTDFSGAHKRCNSDNGQLFVSDSMQMLKSLLGGLSGIYWLELPGTNAAARLQNCSSVSAQPGRNFTFLPQPCHEKVDGFLCQYTFKEPCNILQAGDGAQVRYMAYMGFEVSDSATFPPGTIASVEKVGVKYPESKHVCFSGSWMKAPWSCEVMQGGCDHGCNSTTHTCICPAGKTLHPNSITCTDDLCANCAHQCHKEGDTHVCRCNKGYRLAQDGKSCLDINECKDENPCTSVGKDCVNIQGGFECWCKDGFIEEDGVCVDVAICDKCEHMNCSKINGVYQCACRRGFRVSQHDPTKCEMDCDEQDCPANCIPNPELEKKGQFQCFCPDGYIQDLKNNTPICIDINECEIEQQCDHKCENLFGSFRCSCDEGFELHDEYMCVRAEEEIEGGSGSAPPSTPASVLPSVVPPYVKTGSILGITLFMALCAGLVYFLVRNVVKRCGKLTLYSLKGPDMDIFSLQQVTTETYKRLSFDKQFKNDSQRL
ncbi:hypothetical protein PAMA_007208 [Pampus argenteus]